MLVHLRQYRRDDADDVVRSEGEVSPDRDPDEYFDRDGVEAEEWGRITYGGETILRRSSTHDDVVAVSVPKEETEDDDADLPGRTVQLRTGGGSHYVEQARIVEVQDVDP